MDPTHPPQRKVEIKGEISLKSSGDIRDHSGNTYITSALEGVLSKKGIRLRACEVAEGGVQINFENFVDVISVLPLVRCQAENFCL